MKINRHCLYIGILLPPEQRPQNGRRYKTILIEMDIIA